MAAYRLMLAASAERMLARLPEAAAAAIVEFITCPLLEDPGRAGKPLVFGLQGCRSARRGPYQVVYRTDKAEWIVRVVRIEHQADVCRTR